MILLSEQDIFRCLTYADAVAAVEESFRIYENKQFTMPHRMHIDHGKNTLLLMPCFGRDYFATKLVSVFPDNVSTGVPVVNGVVVLNDMHNGQPLALINGRILTAMRTGAVGATGVKYLSQPDASRLGIVGTGVQSFYQVMCTATVRSLSEITVLDTSPIKAAAFVDRLAPHLPGVRLHVAQSAEELLERSQMVITATTSNRPVLPENPDLLAGKLYVGIGSFQPYAREFPDSLYGLIDRIYVDVEHAATESGDVVWPLQQGLMAAEQIHTLGSRIVGGKASSEPQTLFFKSVGMALFDLVVAQAIYGKAQENGLGQPLNL
jgi:ornithine cyclodeaminase/alanine dehydrogenase-like protein (mu-crystallin family)